jgi:FKBP-type peptidyl-prolyl cis-trans isomerase
MHKGRGGVAYEDLVVGDGAVAARGCTVEVDYSLFLNRGGLYRARHEGQGA